ncbi:MAG: LacI family transcriptional regulator [Asticcacaulis sp.]|jgi:LacI family transcriptional regulator|uniref:LacI family DNA-binding transcriptional regulator n=1 Tax=Asticcacaulis sp. TaxID=1872648 RepID=UPI0025BDFCB9|nr:LacI family DNA-binding transcriptional regulator [Asticcacaulis sp.]MCA1936408.1 LacI family transcriptional regulator [Asticcacaulis sp.]
MAASVTLNDVAKAAGVSIASASRAINGLDNVTEEVRERVLAAAGKLKYVPHGAARALAMSRTNTIGVILPDIYGEFFSEIIRGIDVGARASGLHILVSGSHGDVKEAVKAARAMAGRVDGLLVMAPYADADDLSGKLPFNLPLVMMGGVGGQADLPSLVVDNYSGALEAVRHLHEQGCRRIAHIAGPESNLEAQDRLRGYLDGLKEAGLSPQVLPGDFTDGAGYAAVQTLLAQEQMPDGLFAANDMMALGATLGLREAGVSIPDDIAIIGFDDIPVTRYASPPISTLRAGVFDIGRRSLELLSALIERGSAEASASAASLIVRPELVVRASSRRR